MKVRSLCDFYLLRFHNSRIWNCSAIYQLTQLIFILVIPMAEGGFNPPRLPGNKSNRPPRSSQMQTVCRYYLHGVCNRGSNCNFLHDKSRGLPVDKVCKFNLAGCCSYGSRCRFDHVKKSDGDSSGDNDMNQPQKENKQRKVLGNVQERKVTMLKLTKGGILEEISKDEQQHSSSNGLSAAAFNFVPGRKFHGTGMGYADAVQAAGRQEVWENDSSKKEEDLLCPYFAHGHCPYEDECQYIHGDVCEMCGFPRLHPTDQEQRAAHEKECLEEHEKAMELAFIMQTSSEKECGICLEKVLDKSSEENGGKPDHRFGLLQNCNHCFCLDCIKEWRAKRSAEKLTHRSCPVCRIPSGFVTPSMFWTDDPEMKKQIIDSYLKEVGKKPCQYFKEGKGNCAFGNNCFYRHSLPDGTIAPREPVHRLRRRVGEHGVGWYYGQRLLWDYLVGRAEEFTDFDLTDLGAVDMIFNTVDTDRPWMDELEARISSLNADSSSEVSDEEFLNVEEDPDDLYADEYY